MDVAGSAGALVPAHRPGRAWRPMKLDIGRQTALHAGSLQCSFCPRAQVGLMRGLRSYPHEVGLTPLYRREHVGDLFGGWPDEI